MTEECAYSFSDLFFAAHKRKMTVSEKHAFMTLTQANINEKVKVMATQAGWGTQDKKGDDGKIYTAFCPTWSQ